MSAGMQSFLLDLASYRLSGASLHRIDAKLDFCLGSRLSINEARGFIIIAHEKVGRMTAALIAINAGIVHVEATFYILRNTIFDVRHDVWVG